ncbi:MAG: class I SAM-dependent methyltransferase [Bradyrhizobiaceae bacterium]|nr:class I SAM-dependent methyltransferase [Bradyrhizobiaceae bacterium]
MGRMAAFLRGAIPVALLLGVIGHALSQEGRYDTFIPYVPTPEHVVDRMLELAEVGPEDHVFDLGSGDGRIVITAAKKFGARALGIEIDPKLVEEARRNAAEAGVAERTTFLVQDLFVAPLRDATVITLYVLLPTNLELRPRLLEELRPGSRIVSHVFSMGGWLADRHENFRGVDLYLWIVPAHVTGTWEVTDGARGFTVAFEQQFQEVSGRALIEGRTIPLREAKLQGDRLEFILEHPEGGTATYRGKVTGDRMTALAEAGGKAANWSARRTLRSPRPIDGKP